VAVEVTDAGERTLPEIAEQMVADYVPAGETADRSDVSVDGAEGVLLDNLVGQDLNRRVAVVQGDKLYSLMFMPLSPEAEEFYASVLDSLRFLE
jgi:hypothetical protein